MAGTPVKSWRTVRAGVKAISRLGAFSGSQRASARMSSRVTVTPSSVRSKFSSRMRSEYGRRLTSTPSRSRACSRKISYSRSPTRSVARASKLFMGLRVSGLSRFRSELSRAADRVPACYLCRHNVKCTPNHERDEPESYRRRGQGPHQAGGRSRQDAVRIVPATGSGRKGSGLRWIRRECRSGIPHRRCDQRR